MAGENQENSGQDKVFRRLKKKADRVAALVMRQNIYKRSTFDKLVELEKDISGIIQKTHRKFEEVLAAAGIGAPMDLLNRSMAHWDRILSISEVLPEEQLIAQLRQDFQLHLTRASRVFVPTDDLEFQHGDGQESEETGENVNRVSQALQTLIHMQLGNTNILLDDIEVTVGSVPQHSWRKRPYWVLNLKDYKIAVFVNNQHGNRTFVVGYRSRSELETFLGYTKEQFKNLAQTGTPVHHFVYENPVQFEEELQSAVRKVFEGTVIFAPYQSYPEARTAVQLLRIQDADEYQLRYKEDPRLPANPYETYGDSFVSMGDFLGTGAKSKVERGQELYTVYEEARNAVQVLGIKDQAEYRVRYKEDPRLPSGPDKKYGKAFRSWRDFLGTGAKSKVERGQELYPTYAEARIAAHALKIKDQDEYRQGYKKDSRLPANPVRKYGSAFMGWGDYLGTGAKSNAERGQEQYSTCEEAGQAALALGITNKTEYEKRYKEDPRLPASPRAKYKEAFKGWPDFFGRK